MKILLILLLVATGFPVVTSVWAAVPPDSIVVGTDLLPLVSSRQADVDEFNKRIFDALALGERWPAEPMDLALHLLGYGDGARLKSVTCRYQEGENPTATTVTVLWEGLQDDSVRGVWIRLELKKSDHGNWRVVEMNRAYRCWRGCNRERFSERACP